MGQRRNLIFIQMGDHGQYCRVAFYKEHLEDVLRFHLELTRNNARRVSKLVVDEFPARVLTLRRELPDPLLFPTRIVCVPISRTTRNVIAKFWRGRPRLGFNYTEGGRPPICTAIPTLEHSDEIS